mmetsp:Transcript_25301/g.66166  ORF Transcript_25301/g.66166 Transcript_25301/m.66166 type:complete len:278 (-) Transcript_25301:106-939(-)
MWVRLMISIHGVGNQCHSVINCNEINVTIEVVKIPVPSLCHHCQLLLQPLDALGPSGVEVGPKRNLAVLIVHCRSERPLDVRLPRCDAIVEHLGVASVCCECGSAANRCGTVTARSDELLSLVKYLSHNAERPRGHRSSATTAAMSKHCGRLIERLKHIGLHQLHAVRPAYPGAEQAIHLGEHLLCVKSVGQQRRKDVLEIGLHHHHDDVGVPSVVRVDVRCHLAANGQPTLLDPSWHRWRCGSCSGTFGTFLQRFQPLGENHLLLRQRLSLIFLIT